ncbi:hypothetical protein BCR37DRAFT_413658 [Protomyces lactucae-debilis]|uniref:Myosin-binding domain-containing protein n=1 Tax=Protomyces lactucae-debilis TaxID=2754530 RepID=A0A1Y2FDD8_PROLT|nr:uncharacterized protein BCR37DRAFT_413658 [Protomyces lactucae-debilis]ORY81942.1 hypothetical protein BCR37DRAFT_413658 [Protomyces lactucae-debilis]
MAYKPMSHNGHLNAYLDELAHNTNARRRYGLEDSVSHLDILPPPPPIADYGYYSSGTTSPTQTDFAPPSSASSVAPWPSKTRFGSAQVTRPLRLTPTTGGKQGRFQALFETALSPRVPVRESARFLERFRYVLCTSQLLADKVLAVQQQQQGPQRRLGRSELRAPSNFQFDADEQATWDERRVAKYWMGSGGCVLLVSLLLVWSNKRAATSSTLHNKSKASATLFLTLLLARFMWAQSRRAYRRLLHVRAADRCEQFVLHCQLLDSLCAQAIRFIEQDNAMQETVRFTLTASLNLLYAALDRSFDVLQGVASLNESSKLAEMYNIELRPIQQGEGCFDDTMHLTCDASSSAGQLTDLMQNIHQRRRKVLCCLLAVQADGRPDHTAVWRTVIEQLATLSQLTAGLGHQLEEVLHTAAMQKQLPPMSRVQQTRRRAREMTMVSQSLRSTQARLITLRQQSTLLLQGDEVSESEDHEVAAREALLRQYDALGSDLDALMADWQSGRDALAHSQRPIVPIRAFLTEGAADTSTAGHAGAVSKRPDSLGFWGPRISVLGTGGLSLDRNDVQSLDAVFEGYSLDTTKQSGDEGRARQIAAMRAEREAKQARTAMRLQMQHAATSDASTSQQHRQVTFASIPNVQERPASLVQPQQQQQGGRRLRGLRLSIGVAPQHTYSDRLSVVGEEGSIDARKRMTVGGRPVSGYVTQADAAAAVAARKQQQHGAETRRPAGMRESLVRNVSTGSDGSALSLATWATGDSGLGASTASYGSRF